MGVFIFVFVFGVGREGSYGYWFFRRCFVCWEGRGLIVTVSFISCSFYEEYFKLIVVVGGLRW